MRSVIDLRHSLGERVRSWIRDLKAPKMVYGHRSGDGRFNPRTRISDTVCMSHPERISIGDNVFIWHYTILDGTGGIEIAEGAQIGAWVGVFTHSSHVAIRLYGRHYFEVPEDEKAGYGIARVKIDRYAFIAPGSTILPGVTVGEGAVVAAGSVVKNDVPPFTLVSGNPATVRGSTRHLDATYLADPVLAAWYREWQAAGA